MSHERERRIVIVGRTGNGKSALGNNLLGRPAFESKRGQNAVTTSCKLEERMYNENNIKIVDTPGLFTPTAGNNVASQALVVLESLNICRNPHAFLLVIRDDCRYTEEELSTADVLEITFGPQLFQHAIVVITHVENKIPDKELETEWKESNELKRLIEKCDNRVARIENTNPDSAHINNIILYVDEVSMNGSKEYLNVYENCHKEVLREKAKLAGFDGKKAHKQVSSLSKGIKQAIERRELREREQAVAQKEESVKKLKESVKKRKKSVKEREKTVEEREKTVEEREKLVKNREESVEKSERKGMMVGSVASAAVVGVATAASGGVMPAIGWAFAKAGATGVAAAAIGSVANWFRKG